MGLDIQKYVKIQDEDDVLFEELIMGKTLEEVRYILSQKDYYYHNTLIKDICDGECSEEICDHILIVDTEFSKITTIYMYQ
jgi:hypothetical protein